VLCLQHVQVKTNVCMEKPFQIKRRFPGSLNTDKDDRGLQFLSMQPLSLWMYVVILVDDNLITEAFEITKKCD